MIPAFPAFLPGDHQVSLLQHLQMLHHRATVHIRKGLAEHAGRPRRLFEHIEDFAPAAMRQGLENEVAIRSA